MFVLRVSEFSISGCRFGFCMSKSSPVTAALPGLLDFEEPKSSLLLLLLLLSSAHLSAELSAQLQLAPSYWRRRDPPVYLSVPQMPSAQLTAQLSSQLTPLYWRRRDPPVYLRGRVENAKKRLFVFNAKLCFYCFFHT